MLRKSPPKAKAGKLYPRFVDAIPDRHGGVPFLFFRRHGKRIPLPRVMGTEEFWRAYSGCIAGKPIEAPLQVAGTVKAGTFEAVIADICASAPFKVYPGRGNRMASFNRIRRLELGNVALKVATKESLGAIVTNLAVEKPGAARDLQAAFGMIYKHANLTNPLAGMKKPALKNPEGRKCWEDSEVEQYRRHHPLGTTARLALEVFLYTALRCVDAVRAGPATLKKGRIVLIQQKLQRFGKKAEVSIPVHPRLQEALDAMSVTGKDTWLIRVKGSKWDGRGLSAQFAKWCDEAGIPTTCRAHGLRKVCAKRLIEAGVSPADAAAITGHIDLAELMDYAAAWQRSIGADRGIAALT